MVGGMPVSESMKSIISAAGREPRTRGPEVVEEVGAAVALQPDDHAERAHVHEHVGEQVEQHATR